MLFLLILPFLTVLQAGSTPLHWAARGGHVDCVACLLAQPNCKVTVTNKLGDTPLHNAAWKGNVDCVTALLEAGADRSARNASKETPYDLAKTKSPDCARYVITRGHAVAHPCLLDFSWFEAALQLKTTETLMKTNRKIHACKPPCRCDFLCGWLRRRDARGP